MNFAIKSLIIFGIFLLLPIIGCSGGSSESDFPKG